MKRHFVLLALIAGGVAALFGYSYYTEADLFGAIMSYFRKVQTKVTATSEELTGSLDPYDKALDLISGFEGFSAKAYPDADGYSIGYGHFITASDPYNSSSVISESEAWDLLAQDVRGAQACVQNSVTAQLNANQIAALISLVYNIGCGAFQGSTLLKKLNSGDYAGAAAEFSRWTRSQGNVIQALVDRRSQEQQVFTS